MSSISTNHTETFGYAVRRVLRDNPEICEAMDLNRVDLHDLVRRTIEETYGSPRLHDLYYSEYDVNAMSFKCYLKYLRQ